MAERKQRYGINPRSPTLQVFQALDRCRNICTFQKCMHHPARAGHGLKCCSKPPSHWQLAMHGCMHASSVHNPSETKSKQWYRGWNVESGKAGGTTVFYVKNGVDLHQETWHSEQFGPSYGRKKADGRNKPYIVNPTGFPNPGSLQKYMHLTELHVSPRSSGAWAQVLQQVT